MRLLVLTSMVLAGLLSGCKAAPSPEADPADIDPKSLYDVEAKLSEGLAVGEAGTLTFSIRPKPGAEVKAETPLRATVEAHGPAKVEVDELGYGDHKRIEGKGPVFEVPLVAEGAGDGKVDVDMTFFICTAELCMRTKEALSLDYSIQ